MIEERRDIEGLEDWTLDDDRDEVTEGRLGRADLCVIYWRDTNNSGHDLSSCGGACL
jgi:hypothetical protein